MRRICLSHSLPAWTRFSIRALSLPSCVATSLVTAIGGIGFSTDCPSLTPFGLSLGPDLPWADEPSPGNLRLSAGRILTCLFAYSYRHSLFPPVHYSLRYSFYPMGTLPYHSRGSMFEIRCSIIHFHVCMSLFSCLPRWSYDSLSSSYLSMM